MRNQFVLWSALFVILLISSPSPAIARNPQIMAAVQSLRSARQQLLQAGTHYHGHRDQAITDIDNALLELKVCLQY